MDLLQIRLNDVLDALNRVKPHIINTQCNHSVKLSREYDMEIFLKHEYKQVTGSYKERGAVNVLSQLTEEQKKNGVIAASAGNHALGLSYHGKKMNIPVTVCMPVTAPQMKVNQCRENNANIVLNGENFTDAKKYAQQMAEEKNMYYVNGYDHPHIIAGQGTVMLEIMEQIENIDAIVIPVGGGGLISGMAVVAKTRNPNIQVIGVESVLCPSMSEALKAGQPIKVKADSALTLADGLCVDMVGSNAFEIIKTCIDKMIIVKEDSISLAILKLLEYEKCIVEGAGAAGIAALVSGQLNFLRGKRVAFVLCGANIDSSVLLKVIEKGLHAEKRLLKCSIDVLDRTGGMTKAVNLFAQHKVNIKDISKKDIFKSKSVYKARLSFLVEFANISHYEKTREKLEVEYPDIIWG